MIRRIAVCAIGAAMLLLAAQDPAAAQRDGAAAGPRPGWLPRRVTLAGDLTAAQRATAIARLEEVERVLLKVPELANPQGFEIMAQFHGGARRLGPGETEQPKNVVEYLVRLFFFYPTKAIAGEGCTCITIRINGIDDLGGSEIVDEPGRAIYIEMARGVPIPLSTQVYEGLLRTRDRSFVYVLLTPGGAIPWRTVTRAEYYNAVIFDIEGKGGAKVAEVRKAFSKTPYQEWMEGAAQRKKDREETLAAMAAMQKPAAEIAKLRKTIEDTEREVTERLKASEAEHKQSNDKALELSHSITGKMRAELDAMTPAQRSMPALIDGALTEGPNATGWRMASDDSPTAWRVLTPDYDYWRARRSPIEVRGILVNISVGGSGLAPPIHNALLQTFDKLDWAALNKLLDVTR